MISTQPSYTEMVDFLRHLFYTGVIINCNLNDDYNTVKNEYQKHCKSNKKAQIEIVKFINERIAEILINDESRLIIFNWDDTTNSGLSLKKEILCVSSEDRKKEALSRILILVDDSGNVNAYPNEFLSECIVSWLCPTKNTTYGLIKGYLNNHNDINWKWVDISPGNQKPYEVNSKYIVCCKEYFDSLHDIELCYPIIGTFKKSNTKWILDNNDNTHSLGWISIKQSCLMYKFKTANTIVILQHEYGRSDIARFLIKNKWYDKFCMMALIECVIANDFHACGDTLIIPIIQLIPLEQI